MRLCPTQLNCIKNYRNTYLPDACCCQFSVFNFNDYWLRLQTENRVCYIQDLFRQFNFLEHDSHFTQFYLYSITYFKIHLFKYMTWDFQTLYQKRDV